MLIPNEKIWTVGKISEYTEEKWPDMYTLTFNGNMVTLTCKIHKTNYKVEDNMLQYCRYPCRGCLRDNPNRPKSRTIQQIKEIFESKFPNVVASPRTCHAKDLVDLECTVHGTKFSTLLEYAREAKNICPDCNNERIKNRGKLKRGDTETEIREKLAGLNMELLSPYVSQKTKVEVLCKKHDLKFLTIMDSIKRSDKLCPACVVDWQKSGAGQRRTHDDYVNLLSDLNINIEVLDTYINAVTKIKHRCKKDGYEWYVTPDKITREASGCPNCGFDRIFMARSKPYTLGNISLKVQGYEPQALDYILRVKNVSPERIVCGARDRIPIVHYEYKGKPSRHFPDIYIPDENRLIEVKSTWTFIGTIEVWNRIRKKRKAAIAAGFKYTVLLMSNESRYLLPKPWYKMKRDDLLNYLAAKDVPMVKIPDLS